MHLNFRIGKHEVFKHFHKWGQALIGIAALISQLLDQITFSATQQVWFVFVDTKRSGNKISVCLKGQYDVYLFE